MDTRFDATVYHQAYINDILGKFFSGIAGFFKEEWFGRNTEVVISTYEKAIQYYKKKIRDPNIPWTPKYPFIVFDPQEFQPEDTYGHYMWGYPFLDIRNAVKQFNPRIYEDDNLFIAPVLNRYQGSFELNLWCSSIYELFDNRVKLFQYFGNIGRPIYPKNIEGYFILPDELVLYEYENSFTGETYNIDWDNNNAEVKLIKNINQNKTTFPFTITPSLILEGVSDGSDKYGGSGDVIGDHRLSVDIRWECAIPTHLILVAYDMPTFSRISDLCLNVGFNYVKASESGDDRLTTPQYIFQKYLLEDSTSVQNIELQHIREYNYIILESDYTDINSNPPVNFTVTLPVSVDNPLKIRVFGKYGQMSEDFHWKLTNDTTVTFISQTLKTLEIDDIISIQIYEETSL